MDIVFPATPACPEAAFSYVIAENHPCYPAMSGHNTICVATALLESGMVPMVEPKTDFVLEAPAGPIRIRATCSGGKAEHITFTNAPAFALPQHLGLQTRVPKGPLGTVTVDIAYGGMWYVVAIYAMSIVMCDVDGHRLIHRYAIVDETAVGLQVQLADAADLVRVGEMIKVATAQQHPVAHPTLRDAGWNIAIRGPPRAGGSASNAVIMSTGHLDWERPGTWTGNIDRSPCGTGTSAVMAMLHAKGLLAIGEEFRHEGILGTIFTGRLVEETTLQSAGGEAIAAVVPEISGSAWITQYSQVRPRREVSVR